MKREDDNLTRKFREMEQPEVSNQLKQRILEAVQRMEAAKGNRTRVSSGKMWRSVSAGAVGVVAAAAMAVAAWHVGGNAGTHQQLSATQMHAAAASTTQSHQTTGQFGLQAASLSVTGRKVLPPDPNGKGPAIQFTVQNIGRTAIGPKDVVGILAFTKSGDSSHVLANSDWIGFVNGPAMALNPGSNFTWTFRPVGVPTTKNGTWIGKPVLRFFNSKTVSASQADKLISTIAGVQLQGIHTVSRSHFDSYQSFETTATLVNHTSQTLSLQKLLTIVWFTPTGGGSWTNSSAIRFFDGVQTADGSTQSVVSGASVRVVLPPLIGPAHPDFVQWKVHVAVIHRQW